MHFKTYITLSTQITQFPPPTKKLLYHLLLVTFTNEESYKWGFIQNAYQASAVELTETNTWNETPSGSLQNTLNVHINSHLQWNRHYIWKFCSLWCTRLVKLYCGSSTRVRQLASVFLYFILATLQFLFKSFDLKLNKCAIHSWLEILSD